jgi:hypothetical protein
MYQSKMLMTDVYQVYCKSAGTEKMKYIKKAHSNNATTYTTRNTVDQTLVTDMSPYCLSSQNIAFASKINLCLEEKISSSYKIVSTQTL